MIKAANLDEIKYINYGFLNAEESADFLANENALYLKQVHGEDVIFATSLDIGQEVESDGFATPETGLKLAIKTADCVPVLFADKKQKIVAAAHAGWKGALKGIIKNTIEAMRRLGAKEADIVAAIGPAIRQESYSVKEDFISTFAEFDESGLTFYDKNNRRFNLPAYVKSKIEAEGVQNISDCAINTFTDESFNSYRRDKRLGDKRNISFIEIICAKF